ncbi:oxidoreductase domain protein [Beutenbergia cavernae DSM 12333]|uniref:Oxidoreductase domain protein n=1 Tax=Beutenbergia cavernae (strain ATCC BAA-8 / DSM 12333 / CCUG 43141 / JCM 11478 / NBRC 16432 / NCIMB 13614 / HKI 0122) TaxID=471853 RepID=C5C139_BEUC1|nr:Gfo/Idh/MocA family oxidoreductase [Beutenbergia cavernae]ACQ79443.1 oxidoreductase domain protein [Beutenbergia cavernae DSM 12333]
MAARRIALVGAGSMGRNHARVVATSNDAELAVVVDPVPEVGRAVADAHGARWAADLTGLGDVDAVVVAASTEHHYAIVGDVLDAGLPVLVEKPVCPSLAQTEEILERSRTAGVPLMCGLLERYNPAVMVALEMVDAPLQVRAERHSPYVSRIKTGVAWDLLVHDVDLVTRCFGNAEPTSVSVDVGYFHPDSVSGAEDVVETSLRFDGGGIASVSASRIGQRKVRSLVIHELDKMIEVDLLRRGVTAYRHTTIEAQGSGAGYRQATEMEVPEIIGQEPLATQFQRFLALVDGRVDADAERDSILPAHRIVDRALAASRR